MPFIWIRTSPCRAARDLGCNHAWIYLTGPLPWNKWECKGNQLARKDDKHVIHTVPIQWPRNTGWASTAATAPTRCDVDSRVGLSASDFLIEYLSIQKPVIIKGGLYGEAWYCPCLYNHFANLQTLNFLFVVIFNLYTNRAWVGCPPKKVSPLMFIVIRWTGSSLLDFLTTPYHNNPHRTKPHPAYRWRKKSFRKLYGNVAVKQVSIPYAGSVVYCEGFCCIVCKL